ncbi:MAG: hypothetical protein AAF492_09785, partial [Verrucomicrobiota bacterium]
MLAPRPALGVVIEHLRHPPPISTLQILDVRYYSLDEGLKYDVVVQPNGSPKRVRLMYEGAKKLSVDDEGNLVIHLPWGDVREAAPIAWQDIKGKRRPVKVAYRLHGKRVFGFEIQSRYDRRRPLIIDPFILDWGTYAGLTGSGLGGIARDIAFDVFGDVYITGMTDVNIPVIPGVYDPTYNGARDVFVMKFTANANAVVWATYLGGSNQEWGWGIEVDDALDVYVGGFTTSGNFPTTALQTTFGGGGTDGFVSKLNSAGTALLYSTFLGGSGDDRVRAIDINPQNEAFVTGYTSSTNFPLMGTPFQTGPSGSTDAFVSRINPPGTALIASTYLGGSGGDDGYGLRLGPLGSVFVTGRAGASFPVTIGPAYAGGIDGFVTRLRDNLGAPLWYSTYIGGSGFDIGGDIDVNLAEEAYVTGWTQSPDLPTTAGAFQSAAPGGFNDGFAYRLDPSGGSALYCTYLGGSGLDEGWGIRVNQNDEAYISGFTDSADFPTTPNVVQPTIGGGSDLFAFHLNASGSGYGCGEATYIGGSLGEFNTPRCDLTTAFGHDQLGIAATSHSSDFPTTAGVAFPIKPAGNSHQPVIARLTPCEPCNTFQATYGETNLTERGIYGVETL